MRFLFQSWIPWFALAALAYVGMFRLPDWEQHLGAFFVLYATGWIACAGGAGSRIGLLPLLAGAVAFRALLVSLDPMLSHDLYRYVWEGRVQAGGFNPFVHAPDSPLLQPFRDSNWLRINNPQASAIYPPIAQLVFRLLASAGGTTLFKATFCVVDVVGIALLTRALARRGQPLGPVALYAWNPLPIVEIAGSGHLEPLALVPLVLVFLTLSATMNDRQRWVVWLALAASIGIKYGALLFVPFVWRVCRPGARQVAGALVLLGLASLPYAGAGGRLFDSLVLYTEKWRYNDMAFALLMWPLGNLWAAKITAAMLLLGGVGALLRSRLDPARAAGAAWLLLLLLSPTIHPWYLLWVVVLLPLTRSRAAFLWSASIVCSYSFLYPVAGHGPLAPDALWLRLVQIAPVVVAWCLDWRAVRAGNTRAAGAVR